jgi:hypothetical protein
MSLMFSEFHHLQGICILTLHLHFDVSAMPEILVVIFLMSSDSAVTYSECLQLICGDVFV